jgi:hypothetical protein
MYNGKGSEYCFEPFFMFIENSLPFLILIKTQVIKPVILLQGHVYQFK